MAGFCAKIGTRRMGWAYEGAQKPRDLGLSDGRSMRIGNPMQTTGSWRIRLSVGGIRRIGMA